ncbi:MAG: hypothetical protein R2731_13480 [Nocardioides sp.]
MVALFGRRLVVGAREPPPGQLLDRADVDDPVVQEAVQSGHVARQEAAVGGHGVSGQRRPAAVGTVLAQVGQHLLLGLGEGKPVLELLEQAGLLVHLPHEVAHLLQRLGGRLDDQVDAVAEDGQLGVGDQRGDLDERVGPQVQAGHLAVDPHQSVVHEMHPTHLPRSVPFLRNC